MINGVIIKKIIKNEDERGWLGEIYRSDENEYKPVMSYVEASQILELFADRTSINFNPIFLFLWDREILKFIFGIIGKVASPKENI